MEQRDSSPRSYRTVSRSKIPNTVPDVTEASSDSTAGWQPPKMVQRSSFYLPATGTGKLDGVVPGGQGIAQDDGLTQKKTTDGQDVYISSSIDLVENVEMGNNGSSRITEDAPARARVEINNSSSSRSAKEAAAGATVQMKAFSANVTRRQKPQDPGIYAKGAIDGIKVNFTIDSGASLTSVSYHVYQKIPRE